MTNQSTLSHGRLPCSLTVADRERFAQWFRFIRDRRWSRRQKYRLIRHFGCMQSALSASYQERQAIAVGHRREVAANIDESMVLQELTWLEHPDHHLITCVDPNYPEVLHHVTDPPIALYAAGDLSLLEQPKVAIVGSRRPSPVGVKVAEGIAGGLGGLGVAVVSGLALGIDGVAHKAALSAGGPSVAVIGSGIDIVYPRRNAGLYEQLNQQGLILTEYPFGLEPSRFTFPDRNRLVSGLSLGVVIVEAAEKSGTLITARLAMEQNRELMVVPGSALSAQYAGSHRLINDGAALVANVDDVLALLANELAAFCSSPRKQPAVDGLQSLTKTQKAVLALLDFQSTAINRLIECSGMSSADVSCALLELELKGVVATTREGGYIRTA